MRTYSWAGSGSRQHLPQGPLRAQMKGHLATAVMVADSGVRTQGHWLVGGSRGTGQMKTVGAGPVAATEGQEGTRLQVAEGMMGSSAPFS